MLKEHGLEKAHSVRVLITSDWNDTEYAMLKLLPVSGGDGVTRELLQELDLQFDEPMPLRVDDQAAL
ncbi:hypothetical protein DD237_007722 [Peronospora effusa]|uniref:Uncharacterized protein n=1 Tax=Peronospora effusa TaxID=542832 RepID=A0A3R7W6E5_9STRA|nr:hypothetical protein DD237_007722 [Peronospora effusa]